MGQHDDNNRKLIEVIEDLLCHLIRYVELNQIYRACLNPMKITSNQPGQQRHQELTRPQDTVWEASNVTDSRFSLNHLW